jgi:hypothetical protein
MKTFVRVCAVFGFVFFLLVRSVSGFDVSFQVDGGTLVTIADNGFGDLNLNVGTIDFDVTATPVDGAFAAKGRIIEEINTINRSIQIGPQALDPAVFHNVDGSSHSFKVTIDSSTFPVTGPPPRLGWTLIYTAAADDPTPNDVAIPSNSLQLSVTMSDSTPTLLSTLSQAIPLTTPAGQPVEIDQQDLSSDVTGTLDAVSTQVVLSFDPGPGDEIVVGTNGENIFANVFNEEDKCVDKMNNDARKIVSKAGKSDAKCIKNAASSGGGSATACIDDPSATTNADGKLLSDFATRCSPVPAWGVNGGTCTAAPGDCISGAAKQTVNDMVHDLFVGTAVVGTAEIGACQGKLIKAAAKTLADRWKTLRTCKKVNVNSISDDVSLVATCLGPLLQPDPAGKIAKDEGKIDSTNTACIAHGVTPIGPYFPGKCTTAPDVDFADCVKERIRCRFCLGVNVADDVAPPLDCDLFDDGSADGSCP